MQRCFELECQGHIVQCGLSTRYKHYLVRVDGEVAGWVIPDSRDANAYDASGEPIGTLRTLEKAAKAVAEHHIYFR